jgi:hypothetical protein
MPTLFVVDHEYDKGSSGCSRLRHEFPRKHDTEFSEIIGSCVDRYRAGMQRLTREPDLSFGNSFRKFTSTEAAMKRNPRR